MLFGKGTFEFDERGPGNSGGATYHIFIIEKPNISVVGQGKDTIVNIRSDILNASMRDNHCFTTATNTTFTNMIINYKMAPGKSNNYSNSILRWCHNTTFKNIVINTSGGSNVSMYYYNTPSGSTRLEKCTFNTHTNFIGSYSGANVGNSINCVFTRNFPDGTITDCISNQTIDSNYKLINGDNSKYGVYSGEYAWK